MTSELTNSHNEKSERSSVERNIDPSLVQITASKQEIERRMKAFIEKKQHEVDAANAREFCNVYNLDDENADTCARTDAVFVPRTGTKSHFKVSRVINPYGPQTNRNAPSSTSDSQPPAATDNSGGLEERLRNMEKHVKIHNVGKSSTFERIKQLEERILHLESISPEYFDNMSTSGTRNKPYGQESRMACSRDDKMDDMNVLDIDSQIQALKRSLMYSQLGT